MVSWRRLVDNRPENSEFLNRVDKFVEIHGLHHVRIYPKFITRHHVFLFMGRCEHNHGNQLKLVIRLNLLQHFQAVYLGNCQVEQQHGRIFTRSRLKSSA